MTWNNIKQCVCRIEIWNCYRWNRNQWSLSESMKLTSGRLRSIQTARKCLAFNKYQIYCNRCIQKMSKVLRLLCIVMKICERDMLILREEQKQSQNLAIGLKK